MDRTGGVLSFNNEIRDSHLQRNIGKYSQYKEELLPAIGDYYEIYTRPLASLTNGKSLMAYTHDGSSDYSKKINHNYLNDDLEGHHIYNNDEPVFTNFWTGDHNNYLDYVTAVYGHETVPIQFINGILSLNFMDKALELVEPGIVRDIAPVASLAGVVKTNINNFSGTDTRLGLISNQMYARSLVMGAVFNSDRQNTESYKNSQITPSLLTKYGNTDKNINNLPNLISPNHKNGYVVEEYNDDVYIFDDCHEVVNLNPTRIKDALKKNVNQPFVKWNGSAYSVSTGTYYTPLGSDKKNFYVKYQDQTIKTGSGKYLNVTGLETKEFEDSDRRFNDRMEHIVYTDEKIGVSNVTDPEFDQYDIIEPTLSKKSLLSKTNEIFKEHKIHTIYGEHPVNLGFGMGNFVINKETGTTTTDTSTSSQGRSRGRNLLKRNGEVSNINGYDNPFCRVWTYHNQYDRVNKLIRPFTKDDGSAYSLAEVQNMNNNSRSFVKGLNENGGEYLANNTVLRRTGYVNITPSSTDTVDKVDIKKCMFSIENLAWKDVPDRKENLSKEQRGPHGGRIMWFPPYDINFQENINVQWESNTFIGRGERVYTYTNTERTGTLSFTLLIDYPSVLNDLHNESGNKNYPDYDDNDRPDGIEDMEGDILRFFAGCKPLKYKKQVIPVETESETPIETPEPEVKTVKIYVFYPNNYSGHYTLNKSYASLSGNSTIENSGDDKTHIPDIDFAQYLIRGLNIDTLDILHLDKQRGYEMLDRGSEIGISDNTDTRKNTYIPSCSYTKAYHECGKEYEGKDESERRFRYRVDFDLRQPALNLKYNNYQDTASYALNLDINSVRREDVGNKKDATYSFAEFYYAMENLKKQEGEGTEDIYGMEYVKKRLSEIMPASSTTSGDSVEARLKEVCDLFSKDREFVEITIHGGATKQDSKNSNMLANRRAGALRWYIMNSYRKRLESQKPEDNFEIKVGEYDVPEISGYNKDDINSVGPKRERYAVIEVKYKVSDTKKISETDANITQNEENMEHTQAIHMLYNKMLETSEILERYTNSGVASEQDFKEWFNSVQAESYPDYTDEYIENNLDDMENYDVFHNIIYDYCQYKYNEQNEIKDTNDGGYSKNINLSDSIALNPINGGFKTLCSRINDLSQINDTLNDIAQDLTDIEGQEITCNRIKKNIEYYRNEINSQTKELNKYEEGSAEYNTAIDKIQVSISAKTEEAKSLVTEEKELEKLKKKYDDDNKKLQNLISEKSKELTDKIEKINKNIDSINDKLEKLNNKLETTEVKIIEKEEELENYINLAASGTKSYTIKINTLQIQINKLVTEKNKLEKEIEDLANTKSGYIEERTEVEKEIQQKFDKLLMPSVGDIMYLISAIFSSISSKPLYEDVLAQSGVTTSDATFEDENLSYYAYVDNLISSFVCDEKKSPKSVSLRFWNMYAFYLFVRWIEQDVCGIYTDKKNEDLNETLKYAVDEIIKSNKIQYLMTLLIIKERISKNPTSPFNINGVLDYLYNLDFITGPEFSGTSEFIKFEPGETFAPTQEMANAAIDELTGVLNKEAKTIGDVATKDKNNAAKEHGTSISENNEIVDTITEDSAANVVLVNNVSNYKENGYRYETESEYFSKLKDDSPIIYKHIKDKVKYFDPAFHSMSPEGFNARLTFLQQCTRQGQTIEAQTSGNEDSGTAGNLAFGRMPVCVLRIGDFIYSRIIINSMSISYENNGGMQWDLNPEGAGVQPMMAKISMPITILGGQSLEGPISRLQNAVSFNYYANTGVYDNRADRAKPNSLNEEIKTEGKEVQQTVEKNEANVRTNKTTNEKSTDSKYRTDYYYTWSPMNNDTSIEK